MRTSSSSTIRPSAVVVRILLLLSVVSSFTTVQRTVGRSTTRTGATNRNSNSNRNSNNNRHSTTNTRGRLLSSSSSLFSRRTVLSTVGTALLIVPVVELVTRVRANCIDLATIDYPPPLESESWSSSTSTWEGSTTTEEDTAGGATTTTTITLVFHGSGGTDTNTEALMSKLGGPTNAFMIHWYDYSKSTVFAAWNGQHIGTEVAKRLMTSSSSSVSSNNNKNNTTKNSNKAKKKARQKYIFHIIGISVGAMACDACVVELQHQIQQLQQQQKKKYDAEDDEEEEDGNTTTPAVEYYVQETLLDPLCARGIWDLTYGIRHFGRAADYAQQFYNTDDPVPFTNTPMTWAAVVDVTPVRPPAMFGHDWPLVYYTQYRLPPTMTSRSSRTTTTEGGRGSGRRNTPIVPPHEKGQRGEIVTVTTL